ncbi:peptidoglycan recognition family protein [Pelomonas sp. SE-A7]|uniref:peptidoglycan recognition protein family protein n=1 Tax=Pelomonas sp. SE-A7 TaxID=3054953 RepID=UPI00259CEC61|nr:peptidoglycan recognition family protein [Pelomonas sp. SE-A7]MDM4766199.1 peptidoglycan recognition family protein [Pelomonas sp. SE-A7]
MLLKRFLLPLALSLFGLAGLSGCASNKPYVVPAPAIVSMQSWGGTPIQDPGPPQTLTHITLHHQGETWNPARDPAEYLPKLQTWSRQTKRWADIPYHYVIAPDGRIYAARPEGVAGDTNTEYDPRGHLLIMLLGNFEEVEPTREALAATAELMAWSAQRLGLGVDAIATHKDHSKQTVCPGRNLYRHVQSGWLKRAVQARMAGEILPPP